ncbi:unnamed protein product [Notodromas monacha]|uniref:Choline transporter-like protein n=1 Tax=Notodromas monacha TaxID=399045 RepID=A0A7R9BQ44_9CRUS|nr:unnamed protein product [Notodromas monacha]CAG0918512.1 unnamed protein product [Notodromas monacha]
MFDLFRTSNYSEHYFCSERLAGVTLFFVIVVVIVLWIWLWNVVSASYRMALAGAFIADYWTVRGDVASRREVCSAVCLLPRYHLGTAVVGALFLRMSLMLRKSIEWAHNISGRTESMLATIFSTLCECCFRFYDVGLRFKSSRAYSMTMMQGSSFCLSSRNAYRVTQTNIDPWIAEGLAVERTIFCCVSSMLAIATVLGTLIVDQVLDDHSSSSPIICGIFVAILSLIVVSTFAEVWSVGCEALLLNYAVDKEDNDESSEQPLVAADDVIRLFGRQTKQNPAPEPILPDEPETIPEV